jgi:predicted nucleic acid-binding protein
MAAVIDANLVVALVTRDPRRAVVAAQFRAWGEAEESLHAPSLILYEVANALTGLLAAELIRESELDEIWGAVADLSISLHELTDAPGAIRLAIRLGRRSAYDAAYIALATALDAEVWKLDGPLAPNATGAGLPVRLLGG